MPAPKGNQYALGNNGGRPTTYDVKITNEICARIADGESLKTILRDDKMPSSSTIYRWLLEEDKKDFWEKYAKARNIQAELMFEEILDIADDGRNDWMLKESQNDSFVQLNAEAISRSRLRVDTRKWYLSKLAPKKYGEKIDIDVTSGGEKLNNLRDVPTEELRKLAENNE